MWHTLLLWISCAAHLCATHPFTSPHGDSPYRIRAELRSQIDIPEYTAHSKLTKVDAPESIDRQLLWRSEDGRDGEDKGQIAGVERRQTSMYANEEDSKGLQQSQQQHQVMRGSGTSAKTNGPKVHSRRDPESVGSNGQILREQLLMDRDLQIRYMESDKWQVATRQNEERAKSQHGLTKGIVIPSGGEQLLNMTWAAVQVLRDTLDCNLPIEIIYSGSAEMDPHIKEHFEASFKDVRCIDSSLIAAPSHGRGFKRPRPQKKGWEPNQAAGYVHKLFALCHVTSFDEVLLIDGDNVPLLQPEELFQSLQYQVSGNLFWPDYWSGSMGHNEIWLREEAYTLFGLKPPWRDDPNGYATTETGQMLINRVMHRDVLEWAWFLNTHHDVMYSLFWGDTGSFRLAFHLAGKEENFEQVHLRPGIALDINIRVASEGKRKAIKAGNGASMKRRSIESFKFAGTVQFDSAGQLAFYHHTGGSKLAHVGTEFSHMRIFTVSGSPQRAMPILQQGGLYAPDMIDLEALRHCPSHSERIFKYMCGVNTDDVGFPIPAVPISAFPRTAKIVMSLEQKYEDLQRFNHIPLAWWESENGTV